MPNTIVFISQQTAHTITPLSMFPFPFLLTLHTMTYNIVIFFLHVHKQVHKQTKRKEIMDDLLFPPIILMTNTF